MRQRRWLEFLTSYEFELDYSSRRSYVVFGELCRKSLHMSVLIVKEFEWIEQFRDLCLVCELAQQSMRLGILKVNSDFW